MTATDERIKALEEALAKATPGPWRVKTTGNFGNAIEAFSGRTIDNLDDGYRIVATFQSCEPTGKYAAEEANRAANGVAITEAVTLAPALLARLRAAEARLLPETLTDKQREMLARAMLERFPFDIDPDVPPELQRGWNNLHPNYRQAYRLIADELHAILTRIQKEASDEG